MTTADDDEGALAARIIIEQHVSGDGALIDWFAATDADDNPLPLTQTLGMLRLAEGHRHPPSDGRRPMSAAEDEPDKPIERLAVLLTNTRPPGDVEGEWANRLWEAGVRPPPVAGDGHA